jgi:hypothetical protein
MIAPMFGTVSEPLATDRLFLAACICRDGGFGRDITLPFWSVASFITAQAAYCTGETDNGRHA